MYAEGWLKLYVDFPLSEWSASLNALTVLFKGQLYCLSLLVSTKKAGKPRLKFTFHQIRVCHQEYQVNLKSRNAIQWKTAEVGIQTIVLSLRCVMEPLILGLSSAIMRVVMTTAMTMTNTTITQWKLIFTECLLPAKHSLGILNL